MIAIILSYEVDWFSYTLVDYLYTPFLIMVILLAGFMVMRRKIDTNPMYKYYLVGLSVKLFAAMAFLLIFTEYYGYGDTVDYLKSSSAMSNLMFERPGQYLSIFFEQVSYRSSWSYFDMNTKYPVYFMYKDPNTRFVMNISSVFSTLGLRAFMPTTILVAAFSYLGVWKLYLFFTNFYPHLRKQMAIAVLFVPSVIFWGSGVMKDTYTFAASAWLVYNIYMIFYKKEKIIPNIIIGLINGIIIIAIKPYVFAALFPGTIIWLSFDKIKNIQNKVLKAFILPFMISIGFGIIMIGLSALKGQMGDYGSIDKAAKKAKIIQEDLLRSEQYGSNSYNVGTIDGTIGGMLRVAPSSIIAGMYRPFLWETRNPVMLISGLENFCLLLLTLYLLFKLKFVRFFQFIFSDPILIFSLMFTIFFMFAVGMASANFGALVRYKIPAMPFFVASAFIMLDKYKQYKEKGEGKR